MISFRTALAALLVLAASAGGAEDGNPAEPADLYKARVINVVDGDAIDIDIDLGFFVWIREERIHLAGIDAPEPEGETEAAGKAATDHLAGLIGEKMIIVKTILGEDPPDRPGSFGNWLGMVYLDGVDINSRMVEDGHAVERPD